MASPTWWTQVWVSSGSWWWTGKPGVLPSRGLQSRTQLSDWTELNWTEISQVKEFSAFLCMGRCKSLGSLKSFPSYASQQPGASILHFPSELTHREQLLDCRYCSSWVLLGLRNSHLEGRNHGWLWHPCLLIWQEILHFPRGIDCVKKYSWAFRYPGLPDGCPPPLGPAGTLPGSQTWSLSSSLC